LPSNKIKVLFIIPTLEIGGGAEKNAYNLGNKFKDRYDICYLNFYNKTRVYDTGQFVYNHNEKSNKNFISRLLYVFKRLIFIRKVCNEFKPDLVISFGFHSNIIVSICSLFRTYRVILSVRSNLKRESRFIRYLSIALYNRMDVTHVITKKMSRDLSSLGIKNTFHIYNGHNVELYRSMASDVLPTKIPNEAYVYLNIGRLNYAKGQWHLLKAFSVCVEKYPNSMLIIIGEGELNTKIPEAHTDYIVSVISEEFGIVIIIGIMIIYLILALQILKKVENEKDNLIRLTLIGCMSILLIQAFIHLGVNIRMFPTTGMTLPFISYGGSSIIGTSMLCGIILNFTKRRINY